MKTKITLPLFFYNITTVITICGNGPFCITIFTDFPAAQEELFKTLSGHKSFTLQKKKKKKRQLLRSGCCSWP